jgi:hypothetical protein
VRILHRAGSFQRLRHRGCYGVWHVKMRRHLPFPWCCRIVLWRGKTPCARVPVLPVVNPSMFLFSFWFPDCQK